MAKTKIDIISGFLGAGKTTFIRKLLKEAFTGEQVVLIENEFGEIGIDGGFLKDSGIEIREMNSGCICCSLVGDFSASLKEILTRYAPERIIIEPSGVGKLSDVMRAVADVEAEADVESNSAVTVVDVKKCKLYMKNFGEFFNNQIQFANTIVLSRTDVAEQTVTDRTVEMIRAVNPTAVIITTPVELLSGARLREILEQPMDLKTELLRRAAAEEHAHHHHHDEEEHRHHHHDEEGHGHHHHDEEEHGHHHHYGEACSCGHDHDHGHDADEIFESWGLEQVPPMREERLRGLLDQLANTEAYGAVVRCKGMIPTEGRQEWLYFDLVPGETEIRSGEPDYTGRICVIGTELKEAALASAFKAQE